MKKQGDVLVVVEANVHKLIAQNTKEAEDEHQLEEESDLITINKTPKMPILMPFVSLPPFPSVPMASPLLFPLGPHPISMAGSSMLMGEQELGLPLENLHGIVLKPSRAFLRTKTRTVAEKGKKLAYADLVQE